MPTPVIQPTNLSTILQYVEDALVLEGLRIDPAPAALVTLDRTQILWVAQNALPPNLAGALDVILRYGTRNPPGGKEQGGGSFGATVLGRIDVFCRTAYAVDPVGTNKQWIKRQDAFMDAVLNLLWQFHPVDANNNLYTVDAFHLVALRPPQKNTDQWGDCVASFEFEFLPNITGTRYLS